MRFYIVDCAGDVWGDFEKYEDACYELDNYDEELVIENELEIIEGA